jgi:hypothetical protein
VNFEPTYLAVMFRKSAKQLCRHALALEESDRDEFWFVCGVVGSKQKHSVTGLREASLAQDIAAARTILKKLEAML